MSTVALSLVDGLHFKSRARLSNNRDIHNSKRIEKIITSTELKGYLTCESLRPSAGCDGASLRERAATSSYTYYVDRCSQQSEKWTSPGSCIASTVGNVRSWDHYRAVIAFPSNLCFDGRVGTPQSMACNPSLCFYRYGARPGPAQLHVNIHYWDILSGAKTQ